MTGHDEPVDETILRSYVRVPGHVVHRAFDAETVLLNLRTGTYHGLNVTGGRMLDLLRETGSIRATAEAIAREEHHPIDDVTRDLARLCRELADRDLIELDEASNT